MTAPRKPTFEQEQRIQRNRQAKADRYLSRFLHQVRAAGVEKPETNRAVLEEVLASVRSATPAQWEQVAKDMTKENRARGVDKKEDPPSGATFALIIERIEGAISRIDGAGAAAAAQAAEDRELFGELLRQRNDPEIGDATAGKRSA